MELLAVSSGVAIAYVVGWGAIFLVPLVVTALKGQWLLFAAGWLTIGIVWWIAAPRLARPGSWWDRRFYGPAKHRCARLRYDPDFADHEVAESVE